jgi:aspartate ammonia-lyase
MLHEAAHFREESDLLGIRQVPRSAYWGIQTLRASENFSVSRVSLYNYSTLIRSLAMVKKACCLANKELDHLSDEYADAIIQACDEIIEGKFENQFIVDMMQGGAGNS